MIKTLDSYLLRQARGRGAAAKAEPEAAAKNNRHTMEYFALRAGRGHRETSISHYDPQVDALIADLMADPAIAAAQAACEAAHAAAIAVQAAGLDGED
ncbi:MAG: hypothetical protein FJX28_03095 [Alphaproteobacteria bacterium]|nr:hypothetical protein [Alphaproteobacteria bacterium]